jgi:LysM repeat protein
MTQVPTEIDPPVCPLLGLAADPRTHFTYAHPGHRCFAKGKANNVGPDQQVKFCLTAGFTSCSRYAAAVPRDSRVIQAPHTLAGTQATPAGSAPETSTPESGTVVMYVVRDGESLARIAKIYGLTAADLARANDISVSRSLVSGTRLVIPIERHSTAKPDSTMEPAREVVSVASVKRSGARSRASSDL